MTQLQLNTALRTTMLDLITKCVKENDYLDVLPISASELTVPVVDAEGNETFINIKVSVPKGTRDGEGGYIPFDGYAMAEAYAADCADKAEKRKANEAKKAAKIEADKRKREAKAVKAKENKG